MSNVKELDFKSVGTKVGAKKQPNPLESRPIGIKTPMALGQSSDGIFAMHFDIAPQIRDNLRNLILTNHGERVGLYDFGANLKPLTMELSSEQFDEELLVRINTAVSRWMPFVQLDTMERQIATTQNDNLARLELNIRYSVPKLNIANQALKVSFFIGG